MANFSGDVYIAGSLYANGLTGDPGQVLASDGTFLYWSNPGVNFDDDQTFNANVTILGGLNANTVDLLDDYQNNLHLDASLIYYTSNTSETLLLRANSLIMFSNDAYANGVTINTNIIEIGNSTVYSSVNSTAFSGSANNASYLGTVAASNYVNTSGAYTLTNVITHTANLVVNAAIIAGGNSGTAGQVLTSNGNGNVYWMSVTAVGTADNANNAAYLNTKAEANLNVNNALTANDSSYLNHKLEANLNVNNALTANNTSYLNTKSEANLNVNNALTSNNSNYFGGLAGNTGSNGQVITSNGSAVYWANKYTTGSLPPDYPNYGDVWYYTDMEKLFMWINDGGSDYWYDFLPPSS
jgi:hypothetical protein